MPLLSSFGGEDRSGAEWGGVLLRFPLSTSTTRRILCVFPAYAPSFGTFSHAYHLFARVRAFMPPQGLLLIAAYMPEHWPVRFIDENIGHRDRGRVDCGKPGLGTFGSTGADAL